MKPTQLISAPQAAGMAAKGFQTEIIDNLCAALARSPRPPCLLRSPTGSGKTFMLTQVLRRISSQQQVLWLWFVPYVNLVAQTQDGLDNLGSDSGLAARGFAEALQEEPEHGQVLISTVQGVASKKARESGYTLGEDDDKRNMAAFQALAKSKGLKLGVVVDEAHIALKDNTEFGAFVKWLEADYLLMASATPRDDALNKFMAQAGYSGVEVFNVSRAQVVAERLNKAWIQAVVYSLSQSMQSVTDLKMTVLRRAWRQNQLISKLLQSHGLTTVPLLLVQVADGDDAIKEAHEFLMRDLSIPAHAIGVHSAAEPDPVMMAAIAVDTTKQVLVFKKSAGTGFDAPRAFVLASTKLVNDTDFAMQFIGRVMRVPPELQRVFPDSALAPEGLNTAYIFLADAQAQVGFTQAAQAIAGVQAQLEGQTEQLHARPTAHGGVALTNRPTAQSPLMYDLAFAPTVDANGLVVRPASPNAPASLAGYGLGTETPPLAIGEMASLFGAGDAGFPADELDKLTDTANATSGDSPPPKTRGRLPANREELFAAFDERGIRPYPRKQTMAARIVPLQLTTEVKPAFDVLARDVQAAVTTMRLEDAVVKMAVLAAFNKLTDKEIRTELFSGDSFDEDVQVVTDMDALMTRTLDVLKRIGLDEAADRYDVISALAARLTLAVQSSWQIQPEDHRAASSELPEITRAAACWVIHKQEQELDRALSTEWASRAKEELSGPLPDALIAPSAVPFEISRKNIYGVLYCQAGEIARAAEAMSFAAQSMLKNSTYSLADFADDGQVLASSKASSTEPEIFSVAKMDASFEFNTDELAFARALDRESAVVWWHRNPDRKSYSVALMRSDNQQMFYPDFVVCLTHIMDDEPLLRLIETKHDLKDATRKAQHVSKFYGKVLFLTKDVNRVRIVTDEGGLSDMVDLDNLERLHRWMHETKLSVTGQTSHP
ncbi:MAG: DEAD/DEAH box helicase family protein [Cytophagales bacterium]|nr:DEAD/DEAH box helicase family protein [Cytophagales bacterium]